MAEYKMSVKFGSRSDIFTFPKVTVDWSAPTEGEHKMSETGTATVMKIAGEGEYKGLICKSSSRGLWFEGQELWSQRLIEFPGGSVLNVLILFTDAGEAVVQKVTRKPVTGEPVGVKRSDLSPLVAVDMKELTLPDSVLMSGDREVEATLPKEKREIDVEKESSYTLPPPSGHYISPEARLVFNTALGISRNRPECAVKVMMVGASGYGKTWTPKFFADKAGLNHIYMDCAKIRDPEEWFGYREAREGSTVFIRSEFARIIEEGNCVVVLDEFNRLEPWLHNTLYPLLDERGETTVHDEVFKVGPGTIIVGTINTGYRYTGVFELDEALLNRFEFVVEVGPMPAERELDVLIARTPGLESKVASQIVKAANTLRQQDIVCSTRTTLRIASMVVSGMTPRQAFQTAVIQRIPQDGNGTSLRKQVIDSLNTQLGTFKPNYEGVDIFGDNEEVVPPFKTIDKPALYRVTLSKNISTTLLQVQALICLRKLSITGFPPLSLAQAKAILVELEKDSYSFILDERPSDSLILELKRCGINVKCGWE